MKIKEIEQIGLYQCKYCEHFEKCNNATIPCKQFELSDDLYTMAEFFYLYY